MEPALGDGDLLVVAVHTKATQVVADYTTGDIIVFSKPGDPAELVAHRAVEKYIEEETWYFVTKGDHNPSVDHSRVPESCVFGKIVAVNTVPALMLGASGAWYLVICGFAVMSMGLLAKINCTSRRIHPTPV